MPGYGWEDGVAVPCPIGYWAHGYDNQVRTTCAKQASLHGQVGVGSTSITATCQQSLIFFCHAAHRVSVCAAAGTRRALLVVKA